MALCDPCAPLEWWAVLVGLCALCVCAWLDASRKNNP